MLPNLKSWSIHLVMMSTVSLNQKATIGGVITPLERKYYWCWQCPSYQNNHVFFDNHSSLLQLGLHMCVPPPNEKAKVSTSNELGGFGNQYPNKYNFSWLVVGYFNSITLVEDKITRLPLTQTQLNELSTNLTSCELMDLGHHWLTITRTTNGLVLL